MKIIELKLYGFKSFADKTSIKFDSNFIGVVGPNGSGKSNIIDAIKWVFGEQSSKSLRGKNSTDIIFSGTQKRKKANFAEVSLVLENKDNKLPIDYQEIEITRRLYRTGESEYLINNVECRLRDILELFVDTGIGKDSFSIISQGKVEEIIMSKPENRRQIIEEVSGVLKYKKRKEQATRKLEKTNINLEQIAIILEQLTERLIPLEKQREKALKYNDLIKELEIVEKTYLANKIHELNENLNAYKELKKELELKKNKVNTEINLNENNLTLLENNEIEIKDQIKIIEREINLKQEEIYNLQSNFKILNERKKFLSDNVEKVSLLTNENENFQKKINDNELEIINLKEDRKELEERITEFKTKLTSYKEQVYKNQELINDLEQQQIKNKIPHAITKILEQNQFKNGKILKDIFNVEDKYYDIINILIGSRLNNVIYQDFNIIKDAIKYLNEYKLGRVTFICLDNIKEFEQKYDFSKYHNDGFITMANEIINTKNEYKKIFDQFLNKTLIVKDIDSANNLIKKIPNNFKIITLNGEIISNNGLITGGSITKINPLIAEKKLINLKQDNDKIKIEYQKLLKTIQDDEIELQNLIFKLNLLIDESKQLTTKIEFNNYELKDLNFNNENDSQIEENLKQLRNDFTKLHNNKIVLNKELENISQKRQDLIYLIKNDNNEIKLLTQEENDYNISINKIEMKMDLLLTDLANNYSLSYEMAYNSVEKNVNISEYKNRTKLLKNKISDLGNINIDSIEEYDEVKEEYNFMKEQYDDLLISIEKLEKIMNNLDDIVKKQFKDTYDKLRIEFQFIFKELFGGGSADLILTNKEDLLNTGVEIIAQPPGKKLQTISLLSGGEKALTAISLLFSILKIKDISFTILDEVEAALDEINVKRYANYIKIFSEKTQFIVITHRQGTMELVDSLFGVTMIEKGVSSILNVNVNEVEKNV